MTPPPVDLARRLWLEQPLSEFAPGHRARSNLYYSWAALTLLGRAVPCNAVRPSLWVFPPFA